MARKGRVGLANASSSSSRASSKAAVSRQSVAQTPGPLPTRSRRTLTRGFVANSSSDVEELATKEDSSTNKNNNSKPTKRSRFEAVVVPSRRSTTIMQDSDASSVSSLTGSSNVGNPFEDYETPATSKSMTPIGTFNGKSKTKTMDTTGKRKRSNLAVTDTTGDEDMALALQEEEYRSESKPQSRGLPKFVIDSEDEDVEATVESSDEEPLAGPSKRARLWKTAPREATSSAAKIISERAAKVVAKIEKGVIDSEESELSSLPGLASNDEDESDFTEDITSNADPAASRAASESSMTSLASLQATAAAQSSFVRRRSAARANARRFHDQRRRRLLDRKERRRLKLETAHPEIKTMWDDLRAVEVLKPVPAEQPASINRKLKSFQLEGLNWMTRQEQTQYRGGLLGDEMGMGKTIQAVSLIMSDFPAKQPTLVVVPPVALMQWQNEIREYTDGKLKVLVIHGSNSKSKNLSLKELKKFNVLLISYNSLESMYRKEVKGWSRGDEIVKEDSPIHAIQFHRLILDEAHSIKTRTTGIAKACFALKGNFKWCLSGTPVQNRIGEFFSLLRFLEVRPFADYFCEKCDCAQLHWSLNEDYMCDHCNHSGAEHRSVFNEELLNPITGDNISLREQALDKLHLITARVMLRRMKRDHTSSMELPPKEIVIHNEFFGEIERDFSKSIMTNSSRKFDTYVSQGVMLNNYANIFGLIMQMRQVANHPDLLLKKHGEGGQNVLVCQICDEPAEEAIRSRCHHEFCRSCVKAYVQSCEGAGTDADCPRCHIPLSIDWEQPDIEQDEEMVKKSSIINRIKMENWTSSTKIEMLVYDLYKLRSKKQTLKSIVFSQFTSMLQLIEWRLRRAGFNTVMLDGSMTPVQRQRSIDYFMKNTDVEVFLVSLKAGGVALNLTEASRVFIVDPWWNPAAEWQSADRCHRIGQKRPCVITRLCIEDSVESRMVLLQEKKASMISASINNDKVAMEKLSPEDLQFLFRGT